jgi:hypothetical protein
MQTETFGAIVNSRWLFSKRRFRQIVGKLRCAFWPRLYGTKTNAKRKRLMPAENDLGNIAALRVVRDELQRFGPPVVDISAAIEKVGPSVYQNLVNKYLAQPKQKVQEVGEIVKPLLLSLGFLKPDNLVDVARAWARGEQTFE